MEARRFEELSRRVGAAGSRRAALGVLGGALATRLGLGRDTAGAEDLGAEGVPILHCKLPGKKCNKNRKCCSERCVKRRCSCKKKGQSCWEPLRGGLCCSGRCKKGKCK